MYKRQEWGGILGVIQDNGGAEKGWVLGYNEHHFTFALASDGADDGDGLMTYLAGKTRYDEGRFYHVCATYDGAVMRLYVNGKLDGESKAQSGTILYPDHAPLVLGGYVDDDEDHKFHGRLRRHVIYVVSRQRRSSQDCFLNSLFGLRHQRASLKIQGGLLSRKGRFPEGLERLDMLLYFAR